MLEKRRLLSRRQSREEAGANLQHPFVHNELIFDVGTNSNIFAYGVHCQPKLSGVVQHQCRMTRDQRGFGGGRLNIEHVPKFNVSQFPEWSIYKSVLPTSHRIYLEDKPSLHEEYICVLFAHPMNVRNFLPHNFAGGRSLSTVYEGISFVFCGQWKCFIAGSTYLRPRSAATSCDIIRFGMLKTASKRRRQHGQKQHYTKAAAPYLCFQTAHAQSRRNATKESNQTCSLRGLAAESSQCGRKFYVHDAIVHDRRCTSHPNKQ